MDPRRWLDAEPVVQRVLTPAARIAVVRDDVLEGGSKLRFLPFLVHGAREAVFGGPFCGGAPHALSVWARESGARATLFYAARERLHPRQQAALRNGARLEFVRPGYMTVVQKRARDYAEAAGAMFLPLGFDLPAAVDPFMEFLGRLRQRMGQPDEVWCCAGSGMVARCLATAFPSSRIEAVAVGLASRHDAQAFGLNVRLRDAGIPFQREARGQAPFSSDANYDLKAWLACARHARGSAMFLNVAGDPRAGIAAQAAA
jgi:hypothetical protein